MGNRAIIRHKDAGTEIYVQWNGGENSIAAFTTYARMTHQRAAQYGMARLCQIIGNFFTYNECARDDDVRMIGNLSVGIYEKGYFDPKSTDNGEYIFGNDWKVINRDVGVPSVEFLVELDDAQPRHMGKEYIVNWLKENNVPYKEHEEDE